MARELPVELNLELGTVCGTQHRTGECQWNSTRNKGTGSGTQQGTMGLPVDSTRNKGTASETQHETTGLAVEELEHEVVQEICVFPLEQQFHN